MAKRQTKPAARRGKAVQRARPGGKADNLWQETATLRWEGLPAGLYSVILVDATGWRYVGKVAVE